MEYEAPKIFRICLELKIVDDHCNRYDITALWVKRVEPNRVLCQTIDNRTIYLKYFGCIDNL